MTAIDFSQTALDNTTSLGQQQLQEAKQRIEILEAQLRIYEEQRIQHEDLQKHMRNSYASFGRDIDEFKKAAAIAELRNQELKEENIKLNAQLSSKIDLLLKERTELMQTLSNHNSEWFATPNRGDTVFLGYCCHRFERIEVQLDTDERKITHVRGVNLLQ